MQSIVAAMLREHLGFREEVVLTPQDGFVTHARPDVVYSLGPGRAIIAEVERGGAITNRNGAGIAREHPCNRVLTRLDSFFGDPGREIDVVSLHVLGYGREARTSSTSIRRGESSTAWRCRQPSATEWCASRPGATGEG